MVVETLLGNALAPTVAFDLFDVVFVLLAICKAFVALYRVVKVFELLLLLVVVLLDCFVLLHSPALLELQLLLDPASRELIKVFF
jgi:hypothetical protein